MLSYETLPEVEKGVLVAFVQPKSPAYNSGLQVGDVLVEVNGIAVGSSREMLQQIGYKIGEPMMLKVKRAVPLDMDWDGRVRKYETISTDIRLTPEVLDVEIYGDKAEYLT
ncbi:hypothetical protein HK096_007755 [Nowakowskiella sp. JEL0078]|nr:hypothetical protein HK096_007755 [Nowakowskiella sp. JEL0078]